MFKPRKCVEHRTVPTNLTRKSDIRSYLKYPARIGRPLFAAAHRTVQTGDKESPSPIKFATCRLQVIEQHVSA